jgi:hypothetical protein
MPNLNEEVSESMATAARTVSLQNLGLQLIVGPNVIIPNRTISIPVSTTGDPAVNAIPYLNGGANTTEYKKILAAFSQGTSPNGAPATIKLGSMGSAAGATGGNTWTGTMSAGEIIADLNGVMVTQVWVTDLNTTLAALAAALQTALRAQTNGDSTSTFSYNPSNGHLTFVAKAGVSVFVGYDVVGIMSYDTVAFTAMSYSAAEAYNDALTAIAKEDDGWYQLTIASALTADILLVSAWVNANGSPKFFAYMTSDANVLNIAPAADRALGAAGTVAAQVLATVAKRTAAFFSALGQYLDASIMGYISGFQPGMYNVAYTKPDGGMTPDVLTQTQEDNARGYYALVSGEDTFTRGKDVNTLERVAGFNIIRWGTCQDGTSWIDAVIFQDYLVGALQAAVFQVLVNNPKVPYDINGKAMIIAAMEAVFRPLVSLPGVTRPITAYAEDVNKKQIGGYNIKFPSFTDPNSPDGYVSTADRLARVLNHLKWECWYSGAINSVHMTGVIS